MTKFVYYTSADNPGTDSSWSVYVEQYATDTSPEPVDGSTRRVSTHSTEVAADAEADRLSTL